MVLPEAELSNDSMPPAAAVRPAWKVTGTVVGSPASPRALKSSAPLLATSRVVANALQLTLAVARPAPAGVDGGRRPRSRRFRGGPRSRPNRRPTSRSPPFRRRPRCTGGARGLVDFEGDGLGAGVPRANWTAWIPPVPPRVLVPPVPLQAPSLSPGSCTMSLPPCTSTRVVPEARVTLAVSVAPLPLMLQLPCAAGSLTWVPKPGEGRGQPEQQSEDDDHQGPDGKGSRRHRSGQALGQSDEFQSRPAEGSRARETGLLSSTSSRPVRPLPATTSGSTTAHHGLRSPPQPPA